MARLADWLRLARVPLLPTAAFDAAACALLARGPGFAREGAAPASLGGLGLLAATSALVYAAGMVGNDWADRRVDRTLHPERPIPSGAIPAWAAGAVALACAAGALALGGGPLGDRRAVAAALAFAAAYDLGGKRSSVAGPACMLGVRASNAAIAVAPLLVAGTTHALSALAPLLVGATSAGITILSEAEEPGRSATRRLVLARIAAGLAFAGAAVLAMLGAGSLTFGAIFAAGVVFGTASGRTPRTSRMRCPAARGTGEPATRVPVPVRGQVLELLLGLYWLAAVIAGGGSAASDMGFALGAFGAAFAAIVASQLAIRALRARG